MGAPKAADDVAYERLHQKHDGRQPQPGSSEWRSLKYEEVFLHRYDGVPGSIGRYLVFFNEERPHQALGYQTPLAVYRASIKEQRRHAT
jgi:transposase InsO family protein